MSWGWAVIDIGTGVYRAQFRYVVTNLSEDGFGMLPILPAYLCDSCFNESGLMGRCTVFPYSDPMAQINECYQ